MNREDLQATTKENPNATLRTVTMLYSIVCYLIGVAALVYLILFIADLWLPITINRGAGLAPDMGGATTLLWNAAVILVWGLQHTVMARPTFKRVWTKVVPVAIERSTYLVFVAIATALMVLCWVPMPAVIWDLSGTLMSTVLMQVYFLGWSITLFSTFLINHFHLFGLQQAFIYIRRQQSKQETFQTPLLYKLVRHPMMSGVLIALWAVPVLTVGRLLFNVLMTTYIFIALNFEERTLAAELGAEYKQYQQNTPSVIPRIRRKQSRNSNSAVGL